MSRAQLVQITPAPQKKLIALVGPPNCGKSTLFNRLTGLRQKVGNYPGVTVEQKLGRMQVPGGATELVDLPGVTSLAGRSDDERVTVDVLHGRMEGLKRPEGVLLVLGFQRSGPKPIDLALCLEGGRCREVRLSFEEGLDAREGASRLEPELFQPELYLGLDVDDDGDPDELDELAELADLDGGDE